MTSYCSSTDPDLERWREQLMQEAYQIAFDEVMLAYTKFAAAAGERQAGVLTLAWAELIAANRIGT
jgi:hypothetical protein